MRRVIVESPFAGADWSDPNDRNLRYLRACIRDCFERGEAAFASHGLYTQPGVLLDTDPLQRRIGIEAGFVWRDAASMTAVYDDLGVTPGMQKGIAHAASINQQVVYRTLGGEWSKR